MLVCSTSRFNNHIRFASDKLQLYDALRSQDYKYSKQITSNIRRPFLTNGFKFHFPLFAKNKKSAVCAPRIDQYVHMNTALFVWV